MYLSNIELVGFKSFASKTKLEFSDGVSAIVGPNGCGKSNIVDAMRWVLGEKKASTLRSETMGDVIFNGSQKRKPTSMAEVTLTINNNKQILPIEYDQVSVTRRLYRSGESEYLLNKTKCRQKDILELFMDTGIGPDSYSVIELKMVEALLSGRIDERRRLFEEAAGIKKYKQRIKESRSRLTAVRDDMARMGDIIEEVRKNVTSLNRQANKTRKYNAYRSELEEVELLLFAHEFKELSLKQGKFSEELQFAKNASLSSEVKYKDYTQDIENLKVELAEVELKYENALAEEKKLVEQIARTKQNIAVDNQKRSSLDEAFQRVTKELETGKFQKEKLELELKNLTDKLVDYENQISLNQEIYEDVKIQRDDTAQKTNELRSKTAKDRELIINLKHKAEALSEQSIRFLSRKESISENIKKIKNQIQEYNSRLQKIEEERIVLEENLNEYENNLSGANNRLLLAEEQKKVLENDVLNYSKLLDEAKSELSARKASLIFLERLETGGDSEKFLSKSDWLKNQEKIMLGEITDAEEHFKNAISVALGDIAQSFIIDNDNSAFDAMELLKTRKKGKASFLNTANTNIIINKIANQDFSQFPGCYGKVIDLIKAEDNIKKIIETHIGNTVIVENRLSALKIINEGADKAVTLDGEVFHKSGFIKGGSISKNEGITIGRRIKIEKLQIEIEGLQQKITDLDEKIKDAKENVFLLDIPQLERDIREAEKELSLNNDKISRLDMQQDAIERNNDMTEDNKQNYIKESEKIQADIEQNEKSAKDIIPQLENYEEEYYKLHQQLLEFEENLLLVDEELKVAEINKIRVQSEFEQNKNNIQRHQIELKNIDLNNEKRNSEISNTNSIKEELQENLILLQKKLDEDEGNIHEYQKKKDFTKEEKNIVSEQIQLNSQSATEIQKDISRKNEATHKIDIILSEIKVHLNYITSRAFENYEVNLNEYNFDFDDSFHIEGAKTKVEELKEKLSKLGNINFQALEEFEMQKERLDFSENQMSDIIDSEKILAETIDEINKEAENRFRVTFDTVRGHFHKLFKTLFGEDATADINLSSDDLLESDIEIHAKPPGKRPHSIEMLSGGEKTLTAIALLFAIYLVKPSPFCILDEVDAPLDDKNVGKFVKMIEEFSNNTQFLLVTHNKKTMVAASTLYGITMQEQGVSKVVSVDVKEN